VARDSARVNIGLGRWYKDLLVHIIITREEARLKRKRILLRRLRGRRVRGWEWGKKVNSLCFIVFNIVAAVPHACVWKTVLQILNRLSRVRIRENYQ